MNINYTIEVPNEYSANLWKLLTDNFNITLTKMQHSPNCEVLYVDLNITESK